jgi:tripartite-type tricarboxylate transporter receptor subunit TctC
MLITGLQPLIEMHKAGRIKIVAVSGATRSPLVPEVPTLKEAGVDVVSSTYTGVFGPAKLPADLTRRLHDAIAPMLADAQLKDKMTQLAMTPWQASGAEVATLMVDERKRFEKLVRASGYQTEDE